MKIRLLIKGDAIQCGEYDFYNPCRTIDICVTDNLIDKEHEHIIGVEVEPQENNNYHEYKAESTEELDNFTIPEHLYETAYCGKRNDDGILILPTEKDDEIKEELEN